MFRHPSLNFLRRASLAGAALAFAAVFGLPHGGAQSASVSSAPDRAHMEEILRGLNRGHSVGQVAVSPDGKYLAWIQGEHEGAEILLAPLNDLAKTRRVTAAAKPDEHCSENGIT